MMRATAVAIDLPSTFDDRHGRGSSRWVWIGLLAIATAGWLLAWVASSGAQMPSFDSGPAFPTGDSPEAVAAGDLNQDAHLDLAVVNARSHTASVLFGDGAGGFVAAPECVVGTTPVGVAIGDLNGDGKPDIVTTNAGSNDLSVLLAPFDGACREPTDVSVGNSPYSVVINDVNLDGKPDLVAANFYSNTVSVLLGDGAGAFGAAQHLPVGNGPQTVALGDLDVDGKSDLAVANFYSNTVSVLRGDGTGQFAPPIDFPVGNGPSFVAIGDLNLDGRPDLVAANAYTSTLSILPGIEGVGLFAPATTVSVLGGPQSVEIGDFNGDGRPDLAVAYSRRNLVSVLPGDGALGFGPAMTCIGGSGPSSFDLLTSGHVNHDGKLDLAVVNSGYDTVSILLNTTVPTPPSDLVVSQVSATISGANITISDVEQNIGSNPAGAFTVAFYFASSPTSATSGTLIGTRSVAGLEANGATDTASTSFQIPNSTPKGTHLVCAVTDVGWAINEVSETNNTRCTTQSYTIGPDLTVPTLGASIAGASITVTDVERNAGNRWAGPSAVAFYFTANPNTPTAGTRIGTRSVPGIAGGGASNAAATRFAIPDATPTGTYSVCAFSDTNAAVDELQEGNNTRCTPGTYNIGPDLVVYALSASKSGGTLSVSDTQRNLGNRRSVACTVSFYLSANTTFDAGDQFLGSRSVPSLAGGGTIQSATTALPIPSGIAPGNYYVLAVSDSGKVVTELNEANNTRATAGTYLIP